MDEDEIAEIDDWSVILSDIFNPVEFSRAFINVISPEGEYIPFEPYDYQIDFLLDDSPRRLVFKSRQVGFSYISSIETLHRCIVRDNYTHLYLAARQDQAAEMINRIYEVYNSLPKALRPIIKSHQATKIEFTDSSKTNISRVIALPSTPAAARTYHGDLTLDEFAFVKDDKKILSAATSVAVREGYQITVGSTGYGRSGAFYNLLKSTGWNINKIIGSRQMYRSIYDEAVSMIDEGIFKSANDPNFIKYVREKTAPIKELDAKNLRAYLEEVRKKNQSSWSLHVISWVMCPDLHYDRIVASSPIPEIELQEYFLHLVDDSFSLFPMKVIKDCSYHLEHYTPEMIAPDSRVIIGCDPGGKINETAIVVMERTKNGRFRVIYHKANRNITLTNIIDELKRLFKKYRASRIYIDTTAGASSIEIQLKKEIGENYVEGIWLSSTKKEDLIMNLLDMFDQRIIEIPFDQKLHYQLHATKMIKTQSGARKYSGKEDSPDKNDDLVWALALAAYDRVLSKDVNLRVEKLKLNVHNSRRGVRRGFYRRY